MKLTNSNAGTYTSTVHKLYEFKQMKSTDNTLAQWEERFKKEIEFEKRETSLF